MRVVLGVLLVVVGLGLHIWSPPLELPDLTIGTVVIPARYAIAITALMVGGVLIGSTARVDNRVVNCTTCGWNGELDLFVRGGGCPECRGDTYHY